MAKHRGFEKLVDGAKDLAGAVKPVAKAGADMGGGAARGGAGLATNVSGFGAGILGSTMSGLSSFAKRHPKITLFAAAFAAIKGVQSVLKKRRDKQEVSAAAAPPAGEPAGNSSFNGFDAPTAAAPTPYTPAQPQQHGAPSAAAAQGEPEMTPQEEEAFIRALLAAAQQQGQQPGGPEAHSPGDGHNHGAPAAEGGSWANKVEASRQPAAGPNQGSGR